MSDTNSPAPQHTYNVGGTLPDGTNLSITVTAPNATAAIEKARSEEPDLKVTNIVRTLVGRG